MTKKGLSVILKKDYKRLCEKFFVDSKGRDTCEASNFDKDKMFSTAKDTYLNGYVYGNNEDYNIIRLYRQPLIGIDNKEGFEKFRNDYKDWLDLHEKVLFTADCCLLCALEKFENIEELDDLSSFIMSLTLNNYGLEFLFVHNFLAGEHSGIPFSSSKEHDASNIRLIMTLLLCVKRQIVDHVKKRFPILDKEKYYNEWKSRGKNFNWFWDYGLLFFVDVCNCDGSRNPITSIEDLPDCDEIRVWGSFYKIDFFGIFKVVLSSARSRIIESTKTHY